MKLRKPSPRDDSKPAYAGQHNGQASLGSIATPIPGNADRPCFQVRLKTPPYQGFRELDILRLARSFRRRSSTSAASISWNQGLGSSRLCQQFLPQRAFEHLCSLRLPTFGAITVPESLEAKTRVPGHVE